MSQKIIKGNQIQLFYENQTLAYATTHTLSLTGNTTDTSSKDHGEFNATNVSSVSWEVTGDYFYTDHEHHDYDLLFDLMLYRRPIYVKIAEVYNYDDNGLYDFGGRPHEWTPSPICRQGYAVITNLQLNASTNEKASYSLTLTGSSPLVKTDYSITPYYVVIKPKSTAETGDMFINTSHLPYINSAWVYSGEWEQRTATQIDLTDGKWNENWAHGLQNPVVRLYFPSPGVPDHLFKDVNIIREISIPDEIYAIGSHAFENSSISTVYIENNAMRYRDNCFSGCVSLDYINKDGNSVNNLNAKQIGNSAFNGCARLGDIYTGNACELIGNLSFTDCASMRTAYFGDSFRRMGDGVFSVSSHPTPKEYHFYTESAPWLGEYPLGPVGYQTVYLHKCASVQDWLNSNQDWNQYSQADIRIAN